MNINVYTASCGQYGQKFPRNDIQCFYGEHLFRNPIMEAKRYKVLGHKFFPYSSKEENILIWIDANIKMKISPEEAVAKFLSWNDVAVFAHPHRRCAYEEFDVLASDPRFNNVWLQAVLANQRKHYEEVVGLERSYGLWECNFIIRRVTRKVNMMFDHWWAEICRWQWRDQVSFPVALMRYGGQVSMKTIMDGDIRNHPDFEYRNHY